MRRVFLVIMLIVTIGLFIPNQGISKRIEKNDKIINSLELGNESIDYDDSEKYNITVLVEVNFNPGDIQKIAVVDEEKLEIQRNIVKDYFQEYNESIACKLGLSDYEYAVSYYSPFIEIVFDDLSEYEERKDNLISSLSKSIDVNYASINYIGSIEADVNSSEWTTNYSLSSAKEDIGVSDLSYTGNGVKVGTIDSGSPDSTANLISGKYTMIASTTNSHCTWVTSIIGGTTGIAEDVYFYCAGLTGSSFTTRINELIATYSVNIINMSYGMNSNGYYDNYNKYIDYIVQYSSCTFIKSAGNNGPSTQPKITSPGCGMNVITVGSISKNKKVSYFSSWYTSNNYLYKPDMVAPGERISNISNLSGTNSGTSFAAPMVTGIVALLMEEFPALKLNPSLVKAALHNGCEKLPSQSLYFDQQCGFGLVNYQNARSYLYDSHYNSFNIPSNGVNGDIVSSYNVTIPATLKIEINANWIINSASVTPNGTSCTPSYTKCYIKIYDIATSTYVKSTSLNSNIGFLDFTNTSNIAKQYRIDIVINGSKATGGIEAGSFVYNMYHEHEYGYSYQWVDLTEHRTYCCCGDNYLEPHVVSPDAFQGGLTVAPCLLCGGFASFGGTWHDGIGSFPYTLNGSFILPNGVIVLEEADMEAYLNGTLVFIYQNDDLLVNSTVPLYFERKNSIQELVKQLN